MHEQSSHEYSLAYYYCTYIYMSMTHNVFISVSIIIIIIIVPVYFIWSGIATLLNRINKPELTVAVDGSLYRFHPHFHDLMVKKINQLLHPGIKVSWGSLSELDFDLLLLLLLLLLAWLIYRSCWVCFNTRQIVHVLDWLGNISLTLCYFFPYSSSVLILTFTFR